MLFNKLTIASMAAVAIRTARADTIYGIAGSAEGFSALGEWSCPPIPFHDSNASREFVCMQRSLF